MIKKRGLPRRSKKKSSEKNINLLKLDDIIITYCLAPATLPAEHLRVVYHTFWAGDFSVLFDLYIDPFQDRVYSCTPDRTYKKNGKKKDL